MQSIEERREIFVKAYLEGLWPGDCAEPLERFTDENGQASIRAATNPDGQRNLQLLQREVDSISEEDQVDLDYARKIFYRLRDQGNVIKQTLVRKPTTVVVQAPAAPNPAANLPHSDEPLLARLRCKEDIVEFGEQISRKVMQLGGHGQGGSRNSLLDALNERLEHILKFNIERDDLEPEEKPQPITRQIVINLPPEVAQAFAAIDGMNLSNVGFTSSSQGRRALLSRKQETLRREIHRMSNEGARPAVVLAYVQSEIRKFGESSIR